MNINTTIIEQYFAEKTIENLKNHWIFYSIEPGQHRCEEPNKENYNKIKEVYEILLKNLKNFVPINLPLWEAFFGTYTMFPKDTTIYLIVGSPNPYDAMVLQDENKNNCIIFDIERIGSYSDDTNKISQIVEQLITHELAHIFTGEKYKYPNIDDSIYNNLSHIVFDEGIAHFLAYNNVLSINWYDKEMNERRKKAYTALISEIKANNEQDKREMLSKATAGVFWEKFGSISGLFAIVDYYNIKEKDFKVFKEIFDGGPSVLMKVIENCKVT